MVLGQEQLCPGGPEMAPLWLGRGAARWGGDSRQGNKQGMCHARSSILQQRDRG